MDKKSNQALGCVAAILLLASLPFLTILIASLESWAAMFIVNRLTTWNLTFSQGFALSMVLSFLCGHHTARGAHESSKEYMTSILFEAFLRPVMAVGVTVLAIWMFGIGV